MAIRSVNAIGTARNIGMSWMLVTIIGALATGFVGIAYANQFGLAVDDPETIFIIFSQLLFHPLISGFLMAAILAAIPFRSVPEDAAVGEALGTLSLSVAGQCILSRLT